MGLRVWDSGSGIDGPGHTSDKEGGVSGDLVSICSSTRVRGFLLKRLKVWGLRLRVKESENWEFRDLGFGSEDEGLGCMFWGLCFEVYSRRSKANGFGLMV